MSVELGQTVAAKSIRKRLFNSPCIDNSGRYYYAVCLCQLDIEVRTFTKSLLNGEEEESFIVKVPQYECP